MGWVDNASPEIDAESQYPTIIAICSVLSVLSITVVCCRLWIRYKKNRVGADDWMATLAMVFALLYSILCIVQTKYGLGLPLAHRPKQNLLPYTRANYAGRPIYQTGISFFKIALLISYQRLLNGTHHVLYRMVVWAAIVFVAVGHLGCALTLILACQPVHKSWDPMRPGTCLPSGPSFTAYAIVTIISDIIVAVIPIPVLLQLKVSIGKKIGLIAIFMLGLFTTLCSVFRYLQINRIQYGDGNSTMLIVWGVIEFNVGNIVSSLPFLAPILLRKARSYTSKYSGGNGSDGNNSGKANYRLARSSEAFKLGSISSSRNGRGTFSTKVTNHHSGSEEVILKNSPDGSIVKSVTYSVQRD